MSQPKSTGFLLNAVIGFLSLLLLVLLGAFFTRMFFPRIQTTRANAHDQLISKVIQVEVLNGCGVPGIASKYTHLLRKNGFDVVESGNFDNFDVTHTFVIDHSGHLENARRVARALGVDYKRVIEESSKDYYLDATIVVGSDYNSLKLN